MTGITRTVRHGGLVKHLRGALATIARLLSHGLKP
jgi:hypothetical protein